MKMCLIKYNYKIDYEAMKSPLTHWFSNTDCHYLAVPKNYTGCTHWKICEEITWLQSLVSDSWWHRAMWTQTTWVRRKKERKYYYWHLWRKLKSCLFWLHLVTFSWHKRDEKLNICYMERYLYFQKRKKCAELWGLISLKTIAKSWHP